VGKSAPGYGLRGFPHANSHHPVINLKEIQPENTLHLSISRTMTDGYSPWSKFNAHRLSVLNARRQAELTNARTLSTNLAATVADAVLESV